MLCHISFINERTGRTRVDKREKREIKLLQIRGRERESGVTTALSHTAVSAQGVLEWKSSICAVSGGLPILFSSPGRRLPE